MKLPLAAIDGKHSYVALSLQPTKKKGKLISLLIIREYDSFALLLS
jgi:hypothetical protein